MGVFQYLLGKEEPESLDEIKDRNWYDRLNSMLGHTPPGYESTTNKAVNTLQETYRILAGKDTGGVERTLDNSDALGAGGYENDEVYKFEEPQEGQDIGGEIQGLTKEEQEEERETWKGIDVIR